MTVSRFVFRVDPSRQIGGAQVVLAAAGVLLRRAFPGLDAAR